MWPPLFLLAPLWKLEGICLQRAGVGEISTCRSSSGRDGCGKKRWCCKTPAKEEEEICWPSEGWDNVGGEGDFWWQVITAELSSQGGGLHISQASSLSCGRLKNTVCQDSPGEASSLAVECVSNCTCAYSFPGWSVCLQNLRRRVERQGFRTFCFCLGVK